MYDKASTRWLNISSAIAILVNRLDWLVLWADAIPGLPRGGLVAIMRAQHELEGHRGRRTPMLPPGIGPFVAQPNTNADSAEALRATLAQTRQALNALRGLYESSLAGLDKPIQARAGQCIAMIDDALKAVEATEGFMT